MAGGAAAANMFVELGDKLHKNINSSIDTIGGYRLSRRAQDLAEDEFAFQKGLESDQWNVEKQMAIQQMQDQDAARRWREGFRRAALGLGNK